jgi:tRNA(Arg) A34 adenosine deaminase TadA
VTWEEAWGGLDDTWRRAFALAWEAFVEGSIAVGVVILGPDGDVIADGRNRSAGSDPVAGQLVGANVAHAEVNALGRVPRGTSGTTLLSTLEPCMMCTAVARLANVAHLRYGAADPVWEGVERMGELNEFFGRRVPSREEVDLGALSTWAGGLALLSVVQWIAGQSGRPAADELAEGHVATTIRAVQPDVAALAGALLADGLVPGVDLSPEQALARWWPAIEAAGTPG